MAIGYYAANLLLDIRMFSRKGCQWQSQITYTVGLSEHDLLEFIVAIKSIPVVIIIILSEGLPKTLDNLARNTTPRERERALADMMGTWLRGDNLPVLPLPTTII